MFRKDKYTTYNGKEYKIVRTKENELFLLSNAEPDIENGFVNYAEGVYQMKVNQSEITDVFYIYSVAKYKGYEFDVIASQREDTVNLGTSNAKLSEELGFYRTDKFYYEKVVPIELVDIYEKKEKTSM